MLTLLQIAASAATVGKAYNKTVSSDYNNAVGNARIVGSKSWIDFTSVTDIEPLTLIDSDIQHEKIMEAVSQFCLKTYMSYYLRAASMLSNLQSVEMLRRLDMLNPNRKIKDSLYDLGSDAFKTAQGVMSTATGSMESAYDSETVTDEPYLDYEYFAPVPNTSVSLENDDLKGNKRLDLSAGQSAKVVFKDDGGEFPVHVNFRLATYTENQDVILAAFGVGSTRNTSKERKHRYKSGELSFADHYFFKDIVKTHRNAMIKSKTNFYEDTLRRRTGQQVTNTMKKGATTAEISGCIIVSARTKLMIEREIQGSLDDFSIRENVLDKVSAMILIVVDPDKEEVTLYRYSVREVITMDFYALKSNSDKGPDMMDLMKSINLARR